MTLLTTNPHQSALLDSDEQTINQTFTLIRPEPPAGGFETYEGSDTKISCPSWFQQHEGSILVIKADSCKIVYGTSGKPRTYFERPRVKSITTPRVGRPIQQSDLTTHGETAKKFDYLTLTSLKNDFREEHTDYPCYIAVTPVQVLDDYGKPFWYLKRCLVVSSRKYMALEFAYAIARLKTDRPAINLAEVLNRMSLTLSKRVGEPLFTDLAISSTAKGRQSRDFFSIGISKTKLAYMVDLIKQSRQVLHSHHFNHCSPTQDMIDVWKNLPIINYGFVNEDLVKEATDNPYGFIEARILGN
jgi:hypothetical protein